MANRFPSSVRLCKSLFLTRCSPPGSLHIQVTHFSHHCYPFLSNFSTCNNRYDFLKSHHQNFYFSSSSSSSSSSEPNSIVELITTKKWSEDLENELEEFHPTLNYETVMYVLKSLQRNPNKALSFFNWVYDEHGLKPSSTVYSLMLRILGNIQTLDDFAAFTKRLEGEDCCVDNRTNLTVMRNLTTEPKRIMAVANDWTRVYENKKSSSGLIVWGILESNSMDDMTKRIPVKKFSETSILKAFWSSTLQKHPLKALCFFRWVKECMGYTHNVVTYNAIIGVLAQKESIKEFWSMVEEMKTAGHYIDIDTYEKIVKRLKTTKMMEDAVKLQELMMVGPYKSLVQECSPSLRIRKQELVV